MESSVGCFRFPSVVDLSLVVLIVLTVLTPTVHSNEPLIGLRFPPDRGGVKTEDTCGAGAICVGPGQMYPIGREVGALFYSTFAVPDLPEQHDSVETTYYDYFNIFWRSNPLGGLMNQFVPQLMLGNALANSTNYPHYDPIWIQMDTWHIGAQYFMGLCQPNSTAPDGFQCDRDAKWIARAATGELVAVEPGEIIETSFELVQVRNRTEWHLHIGVLGQPERSSIVVADRPFMGLVESTISWDEETYEMVYVGSCLENYGMESSKNYPPEWVIAVNTWLPKAHKDPFWREWQIDHDRTCDWQPQSEVTSKNSSTWQRSEWRATVKTHEQKSGNIW